jgi:hypothetical protein
VDAFSLSVLGMLAMTFLIAGTIGFLLWRTTRPPPPGADSGPGSR